MIKTSINFKMWNTQTSDFLISLSYVYEYLIADLETKSEVRLLYKEVISSY